MSSTEYVVFPWDDNLCTHITEIDDQHRTLVKLINQLAVTIVSTSEETPPVAIFDGLANYAEYHFETEEAIWRTHLDRDGWYADHCAAHQDFRTRIATLQRRLGQNATQQDLEELLQFLISWLAYHILDDDRRMSIAHLRAEAGLPLADAQRIAEEEMSGVATVMVETLIKMFESVSSTTLQLLRERAHSSRLQASLEAARRQEQMFSDTVLNAMPDIVGLFDRDGHLVRWNDNLSEASGRDPETLTHVNIVELFDLEPLGGFEELKREITESGKLHGELMLKVRGSSDRQYNATAVAMDVAGNRQFLVSAQDVTPYKDIEASLRETEDRHEEAQRLSRLGHWELEHASNALVWSKEVYRIFELDAETTAPDYDLFLGAIHPEDRDLVNATFTESVAERRPYEIVHRLRMRDGRIKHVREMGRTRYDSNGAPVTSLGTVMDVTAQVEAESRLADQTVALHDALIGVIDSLSNALESRDPYTAGHQRRVAAISCAIAQRLGWDEHRIQGLDLAARIHDIGKISVPSELLSRPGKLTPPEFALIKYHASAGADILKDVEFPWSVREVVAQHHERMDGSGYPAGLRGEEICEEARIVAVADVFEAISADRPYRAGRGIDVATEELRRNAGTHYDQRVVDALLAIVDEDPDLLEPRGF